MPYRLVVVEQSDEEREREAERVHEFVRRHREACEETPNAVRRFMLTRTPRNAPLTK